MLVYNFVYLEHWIKLHLSCNEKSLREANTSSAVKSVFVGFQQAKSVQMLFTRHFWLAWILFLIWGHEKMVFWRLGFNLRSTPGPYPGRDNAIIAVVTREWCSVTRLKDLGRRYFKEYHRSFRHYKDSFGRQAEQWVATKYKT